MVNASIKLFKDIGLYASYAKTIDFLSKSSQNSWFSSKPGLTVTANYNKTQNRFQCEMSYGDALTYTYARIDGLDPSGMPYYFFVSSVELIRETETSNIVAFTLAMDPVQTFMFMSDGTRGWNLGESFVVQEHVDRWSNLSSLPQYVEAFPLSLNCQYEVTKRADIGSYIDGERVKWCHIFYHDSVSNSSSTWAVNKLSVFPLMADGSHLNGPTDIARYPSLNDVWSNYVLDVLQLDPEKVTAIVISDLCIFPWVMGDDGLELVVTMAPYSWGYDEGDTTTVHIKPTGHVSPVPGSGSFLSFDISLSYMDMPLEDVEGSRGYIIPESQSVFSNVSFSLSRPVKPSNNQPADPDYEPALFMAPFVRRTVTTASSLMDYDIPDLVMYENGSFKVSPAFSVNEHYYILVFGGNVPAEPGTREDYMNRAYNEGLLWVGNAPLESVFTNNWLTYSLNERAQDRQILMNNAMSQAIQGAIYGAYGGALVGSRGGLDKGRMSGALAGASMIGGLGSMAGSLVGSFYDFQNQNLEEAKIRNRANKTTMLGNGGIMNAITGLDSITISELTCDNTHYMKGWEWFMKYGYTVNRNEVPDLRSRKYFNFIQTRGCVVTGPLNQDIRDAIAKVFDSGITIFHADYTTTLEYPQNENIERILL